MSYRPNHGDPEARGTVAVQLLPISLRSWKVSPDSSAECVSDKPIHCINLYSLYLPLFTINLQ